MVCGAIALHVLLFLVVGNFFWQDTHSSIEDVVLISFFSQIGLLVVESALFYLRRFIWRLKNVGDQVKSREIILGGLVSIMVLRVVYKVILSFFGHLGGRSIRDLFEPGAWISELYGILSTGIVFAIVVRLIQIKYTAPGEPHFLKFKAPSKKEWETYIHSIFQSDRFLTALGSSLPIADESDKKTFQQIPFILANLDLRRQEFQQSAQRFFQATLVVGSVFAFVVTYFGYVLLHEDAAGVSRRLAAIESSLPLATTALAGIPEKIAKTKEFLKFTESLKKAIPADLEDADKEKIQPLLSSAQSIESVSQLSTFMEQVRKAQAEYQASTEGGVTNKVHVEIRDMLEKIIEAEGVFASTREYHVALLRSATGQLPVMIEGLRKTEEKNRVADLVQRVAIGLIVCSFLLAILRYLALQYRINWDEVVRVDKDELWIRRVCVCLNAAGAAPEERAKALSALVSGTIHDYTGKATADPIPGVIDSATVKDIFTMLLNKIK